MNVAWLTVGTWTNKRNLDDAASGHIDGLVRLVVHRLWRAAQRTALRFSGPPIGVCRALNAGDRAANAIGMLRYVLSP